MSTKTVELCLVLLAGVYGCTQQFDVLACAVIVFAFSSVQLMGTIRWIALDSARLERQYERANQILQWTCLVAAFVFFIRARFLFMCVFAGTAAVAHFSRTPGVAAWTCAHIWLWTPVHLWTPASLVLGVVYTSLVRIPASFFSLPWLLVASGTCDTWFIAHEVASPDLRIVACVRITGMIVLVASMYHKELFGGRFFQQCADLPQYVAPVSEAATAVAVAVPVTPVNVAPPPPVAKHGSVAKIVFTDTTMKF